MSVQILIGDMRSRLKELADASVDSCVTDPPYHLASISKRWAKVARSESTMPRSAPHARASKGFMGQTWDGGDVAFDPETWAEVYRVLKSGAHVVAFSGTRTYHRMACAIEDAGFEIRDQLAWIYGSGFPKSHNLDGEHEGWGTALKPAWEPICFARKPLVGTVAGNMALHGVGAINIDGCRIAYDMADTNPATNPLHRRNAGYANGNACDAGSSSFSLKDGTGERNPNDLGRWPANILHDGSDEVVAAFPIAPGQMADASTSDAPRADRHVYGSLRSARAGEASADSANEGAVGFKMRPGVRRGDEGSAARFFYSAKASKADRGEANPHPTVKPVDLMRWLCRLVTPAGGTVLDPFAGSGSTLIAADAEQFNAIGCELSPEYAALAERRVRDSAGMFAEVRAA